MGPAVGTPDGLMMESGLHLGMNSSSWGNSWLCSLTEARTEVVLPRTATKTPGGLSKALADA